MSVYATRDLDYDDCGWDYEEDGDIVDPANLSFDDACNLLHEHCGNNEVINGEYSLYVSAEFPDGEWESTYLDRHIETTVSDYVRQLEKLYKQLEESRDLFKNRSELLNEENGKMMTERDNARERLDLANDTIATLRGNLSKMGEIIND